MKDLLEYYDNYFLPKKNVTMETFKFNNMMQQENRNIDTYITEPKPDQ